MESSLSVLSILPSISSNSFSAAAWGFFVISMVLFGGASFVLLYHWRTYGISSKQIITAEVVYLTASIVLICFSLISLHYL